MSPKVKVTKQEIIDAAFNIAQNEGLAQVSVRKVAAALDVSVAPIYVNFINAEDLIEAVVQKALDINMDYCSRPYTDQPFLNIGIGSVMLAYDHKRLYRDIVEQKGISDESPNPRNNVMLNLMKSDAKLTGFSDEQIFNILFKMRVFTAGLCTFASADDMPEGMTLEILLSVLEETGNDVIMGERKREGK